MNAQEIFDAVLQHARRQKAPARDANNVCLYRAPDGKRCFIGALIPDELYHLRMEYKDVMTIFELFPEVEARIIQDDQEHKPTILALLDELQYIHDYYPPEFWEAEFEHLAQHHGLTYTPPEAA